MATGSLPHEGEIRLGTVRLPAGKLVTAGLLASRPPRSTRHAQQLAAEQFAFCDECAGKGLRDISEITDHLLTSPIWTFWWD